MYSKILVVFIVVYFLSSSAHGEDKKFFRQDYIYIEALGSLYKNHTTKKNWFDANQVCAQEGASLFYPENDNEAHTVASFFKNDLNTYFYVGMSDLLSPGVYESNDGTSISELYHNWSTNEPKNYWGNENCVIMRNDSPHNISVDFCTTERYFICKKNLQWNYSCHFDYTFNIDTGNCYKLHTTPLNWAAAYATCRNEHSYLAVINNQLEADFLANLTMYASWYLRVGGNYYSGMYHLGFHNKFGRGWLTVKGTPINVECSAWWDHHEPITDKFNQCGSMFFNGRLNTISCDTKSFFICEHEAHYSNSPLEIETNTQLERY